MIVAERKTIPELIEALTGHKKVLVLGCGTCVTVCLAGGEREVSIIASALRMASKLAGNPLEIEEVTIERQCDNVFIEQAAEAMMLTSRSPPARHTVTQVPQPRTRTFLWPFNASISSGIVFLSATIMNVSPNFLNYCSNSMGSVRVYEPYRPYHILYPLRDVPEPRKY